MRKGIRDGCFGQSLMLGEKFGPGAANGFHGIEISLPENGEYSLTAADSFLSHPFSLRSTPSPSERGPGRGLRSRIGPTFQKVSAAWQH